MDIFHSIAVHFLSLFVDFRITHFIIMQPVCNANIMSIMGILSVTLHTLVSVFFSFLCSFWYHVSMWIFEPVRQNAFYYITSVLWIMSIGVGRGGGRGQGGQAPPKI